MKVWLWNKTVLSDLVTVVYQCLTVCQGELSETDYDAIALFKDFYWYLLVSFTYKPNNKYPRMDFPKSLHCVIIRSLLASWKISNILLDYFLVGLNTFQSPLVKHWPRIPSHIRLCKHGSNTLHGVGEATDKCAETLQRDGIDCQYSNFLNKANTETVWVCIPLIQMKGKLEYLIWRPHTFHKPNNKNSSSF